MEQYASVVEMFAAQVDRAPNEIAVEHGSVRMTYAELDQFADLYAVKLASKGITPGTRVGLLMVPQPALIAALLGILRGGFVCVPLDGRLPGARLDYIVRDTGVEVVLTDDGLKPHGVGAPVEFVVLNPKLAARDDIGRGATGPPPPEALAYVLYTSGSEGAPKGVMISHGAVAQHMRQLEGVLGLTSNDRVFQFSSIAFVSAVGQIHATLLAGARLVLRDINMSYAEMVDHLSARSVSVLWVTTSVLSELLHSEGRMDALAAKLRVLRVGGERLSPDLVSEWFRVASTPIINAYGPTEVVQDVSATTITRPTQSVSIGRELEGVKVYLAGEDGSIDESADVGELLIESQGLADGYLNDPELTRERFVWAQAGERKVRLYRSGDLARRLPSGEFVHLGRIDDQIKIRGYRIEPGEIESRLLRHEAITSAAVVKQPGVSGIGDHLVAFYVSAVELQSEELVDWCAAELPRYVVPNRYLRVAGIPLNSNGKTDRAALLGLASR